VVEPVIDFLSNEKLVDLRGGKGFGRASVEFTLTEKGRGYSRDAIERSTYVGPAPVPIEQYNALINSQAEESPVISESELRQGISHLTVPKTITDKLGPAVNSGKSLFLYGPPGNGKTSLAEAISRMLGGEVYVPTAWRSTTRSSRSTTSSTTRRSRWRWAATPAGGARCSRWTTAGSSAGARR